MFTSVFAPSLGDSAWEDGSMPTCKLEAKTVRKSGRRRISICLAERTGTSADKG